MKRLTKRNEANTAYYYPHCFREDTCMGMGYSEKCDQCDFIDEVCEKLGKYEDAEEQGLLKMLPVAIGSDVYFIPSKVNYDLNVLHKHEENNRVYHQQVTNIVFNKRGWYLECNLDLAYATGHILVDKFYKETWFTSKEEAEQALQKMKEGAE